MDYRRSEEPELRTRLCRMVGIRGSQTLWIVDNRRGEERNSSIYADYNARSFGYLESISRQDLLHLVLLHYVKIQSVELGKEVGKIRFPCCILSLVFLHDAQTELYRMSRL